VCIGEPFAELEAPIVISTLVRRWRMRVVDGFTPEAEALTTLRFKHGLPMVVTERR
jgi:cytochrome P450